MHLGEGAWFTMLAFWFFAIGWAASKATTTLQRVAVSVVLIISLHGYFDSTLREVMVMAGLLLLIWVPTIRCPSALTVAVGVLAEASLYTYLVHYQVYALFGGHPARRRPRLAGRGSSAHLCGDGAASLAARPVQSRCARMRRARRAPSAKSENSSATLVSVVTFAVGLSVVECMFEACWRLRFRWRWPRCAPRTSRWPPATSTCSTHRELLTVLDELETLTCQLPAQWHRALARLQAETTPKELGAKIWKDVLRIRWRITATEANRRLAEAAVLGPRRTLTGEPLAPVLAATAAAQGAGLINSEHVDKIRDTMDRIPGFVDAATREQIETDLVRIAAGVGPDRTEESRRHDAVPARPGRPRTR